jgi:acyl carrier protein
MNMSGPSLTPERLTKRLSRIFNKTFPSLDVAAAPKATADTVPGWDSIATLTLFMQCEEDFGIKLGYDRIAETKTYADLYKLVEGLTR